ncbi:LysR family transcriptional regulator [Actibacterium sp. 188UL27-1]|nr:LysR family transcriptional regulator [Actibacterium sp. 188UL27-1]
MGWDDLRTVLALVRHGSLAAAAKHLDVSYTTVSRRITRAEAGLNLTLFERLADGYRPTETAVLVAEHAARMDAAEHDLLRKLRGRDSTLTGPFVLTAPQLLIANFLAPVLDRFCAAHRQVELRVRATNDLLDLNRREADLAIRISHSPGDTLMGLRLTQQHNASFANPEWADQITANPSGPVDWLIYDQYPDVPKAAMQAHLGSRVRMRFDDMVAMLGAAQAGLGVVRTPMFLGRTTPGLVQVPVLPPHPYADIWVVGHPDVWPSAKSVAFRDVLVDYIKAQRALFVA